MNATRAELRLFEAIDDACDKAVECVMMGYGIGQEDPIWIDIDEDPPQRGARLLALNREGKPEVIEKWLLLHEPWRYTHWMPIPKNPSERLP